ncbi:CHAT domain-containing protein [Mycena vulgaris]|nr:CHAT domain-containing protein [Mycena vulgaris]
MSTVEINDDDELFRDRTAPTPKEIQRAAERYPSGNKYTSQDFAVEAGNYLADYMSRGKIESLETCLKCYSAAVALTPPDEVEKLVRRLQNLGLCFKNRHQRLGDPQDYESAYKHLQRAADIDPSVNQRWGMTVMDQVFNTGIERDIALGTYRLAVKETSRDHPDFLAHLARLSAALLDRYEQLQELRDLEEGMGHSKTAVEMATTSDPLRANVLFTLSMFFRHRYEIRDHIPDLEAALERAQAAFDVTPPESPELRRRATALARLYLNRYNRLGAWDDHDSFTEYWMKGSSQRGLNQEPEDSESWTFPGDSAMALYRKFGDTDYRDLAYWHYSYTVRCSPDHWPEHRRDCINLAKWSIEAYRSYGQKRIFRLEFAIDISRYLISLTSVNDAHHLESLDILGRALKLRFENSGNVDDLNEAMKVLEEAVQNTPKGYSRRGGYIGTLAEIRYCKFVQGDQFEDLGAAIQLAEAAVDETLDVDWTLLDHLYRLAEYLGVRYNKQQDPKHPKDLERAFEIYHRSFTGISRHTLPLVTWTAAVKWAKLGWRNRPAESLKAYSMMFYTVLPMLLWLGNPINVHHKVIHKIDITTEISNAVSACIDGSDLRLAIELLEQGLATTLQRITQLAPSFNTLPQGDADKLSQLSAKLYDETSRKWRGEVGQHTTATQRNHLLAEIRARPGFEDFLLPKRFETLRQATQDGPIILLNSHEDHCDVIILLRPDSEPIHMPLPGVSITVLQDHRFRIKEMLQGRDVSRHEKITRLKGKREGAQSSEKTFQDMLDWVWTNIVSLVYTKLESHGISDGRLWWCPTGFFVGLPLHAASQLDRFVQSYTSTPGILYDRILKRPTDRPARVGIAGLTHNGPQRKSALPGVEKEVTQIVEVVGKSRVEMLMGEEATVEAVQKQLQECSWIHLACHANQDLTSPRESCLHLYEGTLSLEVILGMPLPDAEFVYLAACQTAMGDSSLANESFHLGGGFVAAGFRGAIGTMWSMIDEDGPRVAETVYKHLFAEGQQPQVRDAAKAMQLAVRKLREAGVAYERWVPFIHIGV